MSHPRHAATASHPGPRPVPLLVVCGVVSCGRGRGPDSGGASPLPDPPPVQVAVEIGGEEPLPSCASPVPSPGLLTDARATVGVDFTHTESPYPDLGPGWDGDTFAGIFGGGVAAADFDRDGHIDLFLPNGGGANALHWGRGDGTFEPDSARTASVSWPNEDTGFVSAADFDGDADLDLLIGGWETLRLLRNNGDRTFTDVAPAVGLRAAPAYPGASAWADFDGDGDLDVFVGAYGEPTTGFDGAAALPSALYENQGGSFVNVTEQALPYEAGREGLVLHARWQDLDRDGDPDLMQVNDFGATRGATQFWENQGDGTFVDRGPSSGLGTLPYPMGGVAHDLDGDGILDLAFSDLARTHLFVGQGPDPWSWATADAVWGAELVDQDSDASWSVATLDLDGSGEVGLYFAYGPMEGQPLANDPGAPFDPEQPDRLLVPEHGTDGFRLRERAEAFERPQIGRARGLTTTDLNADGVPDVVVGNIGQQPAILLGACTAATRTWVRLEQPDSGNVHAIGAEVTLTVGDRSWSQTILGGGPGSGSAQEPSLHFGLGDAAVVDAAFIRWPDGAISELDGVCAGCVVTFRRGDPLED